MLPIAPCEQLAMPTSRSTIIPARRNLHTALLCAALVAAMIGAAYAAVPLYRLFCELTGFAGTVQRAASAPLNSIDRLITVEFDANTGPGLPWTFLPLQRRLTLRIGEQGLAHYRVANNSARPITGSAVFNVTPALAGRYFNKIQCFCFLEQRLAPGQSVDMPVVFFVDPNIAADKNLATLKTITLSYTFYRLPDDQLSGAPKADAVN
jgi:cytochrome c oxidase assembly protein subunit 11